jgi:hypothetical protein
MKSSYLLLLAILTFAEAAHAQYVVSGPVAVTGDESVLTEGTEVWGGSAGGLQNNSTSYTLTNGVSFGVFNNSNFVSFPGSNVQVDQDGASYGDQAADSISDVGFSDPSLNGALSFGPATGNGGQLFLNIKGLTSGDLYVIQAFASMTHTGNSNGNGGLSGTELVTPGSGDFSGLVPADASTLSWGQTADPANPGSYLNSGAFYVTDTFTANAAGTAFLVFNNSPGTAYELLDAAQIRDITNVPEPTTYAMMFAGLALVAFWVRRRSAIFG